MLVNQILQATNIIQHGGVIAYSTETVLGLGCDPWNESAVKKLLWLKNRAVENGLIVLVADLNTLQHYSKPLDKQHITSIEDSKHTTWLLPSEEKIPKWLTGRHDKIAVRISEHTVARQLAAKTHGIVSTSANLTAHKILSTHNEIRDWFGPHIDYVIIDCVGSGVPSKICDLLSGKIIRSN